MRKFALAAFIFFTVRSHGQNRFEKGYFIDNEGNKTECLIHNIDWMYNPSSFEYKTDIKSIRLVKNVNEVKEFGIQHGARYVSAKVNIDRSSDILEENEISDRFDPEWKEEQLFLKVLYEGKATLFSFEESNFARFFYQVKPSPIEQLIYKRYKMAGEASFTYNNSYLNQLYVHVNCKNVPLNKLENISYTSHSLGKWFQNNNQCFSSNDSNTYDTKKRRWFSPKILGGIEYLSYRSGNSGDPAIANIQFDPKISLSFGAEIEFIFPFNNNKWSMPLELSTLSYKSSGSNNNGNKIQLEYYTINILLAIRYYSYLNDKLKILFDCGLAKDRKQRKLIPGLGVGISYSRFMTELRYFFRKGLYDEYFSLTAGEQFKNVSLMVKYRLF